MFRTPTPTVLQTRASTHDLAIQRVRLLDGQTLPLENRLVYTNLERYEPEFAAACKKLIYCDRVATLDPVELCSLGRATVHAGEYVVSVDGVAVKEQVTTVKAADEVIELQSDQTSSTIDGETIIIARFGAWTWGHWLGELLPKIVLAEHAFPGRFRYAIAHRYDLPEFVTFWQSLQAYGIAPERLVLLESAKDYVLTNAWAVTPVWSDDVMHPGAAQAMRTRQKPTTKRDATSPKIMLARRKDAARQLENSAEIEDFLRADGYVAVDIAALSFQDQARAFSNARCLFSTLGSGLSGLIFSPSGVCVTSVAPSIFGDRFFYALILDRNGIYADVRGPVMKVAVDIAHRSSFNVEFKDVVEGLQAVATRADLVRTGFDETYYLAKYPDVREAVATGALKSAAHHYFMFGVKEGRLPSLASEDLSQTVEAGKAFDLSPALEEAGTKRGVQFNVSGALHEADHILSYFINFSSRTAQFGAEGGIEEYFIAGKNDADKVRALMAKLGLRPGASILEFAAGYGRVSRHLADLTLTASDIHGEAIRLLRNKLGIRAIASSPSPEDFKADQIFDFIFVLSLFSHLPEALFRPWLVALIDCLAPGGFIMFTTHGEVAAQKVPVLKEALSSGTGFGYVVHSDQADLSPEIYGSNIATRDYVTGIIDSIDTISLHSFTPGAWWELEDEWIVKRRA